MNKMDYVKPRSSIFSCLSENVREMFCVVGVSTEIVDLFSASHFTLDINKLGELLENSDNDNSIGAPWCKKTLSRLSASINHVKDVYSATSFDTFKKWSLFLSWTAEAKVFEDCFHRLQDPDRCGTILSVLHMTAVLERCLGDVLFTERVPVPFLLKDILGTQKLGQIFGRELMALLRVVMGPPCSLNLRNVVWHGFMTSEELDPRYAYFLICTVITMGERLEKSGRGSILRRKLFNFSSLEPSLHTLSEAEFDENGFLSLLELSSLVLPGRLATWRTCIKLYRKALYGDCLVLSLPEVECMLRVLFTTANKCHQRLLTAEMSTLYTTLDEILNEFTESGTENEIRSILGDSLLEMYLDLFLYPEGPRLRDRVSHGEADLATVGASLVIHLFSTVAAACIVSLPKDHCFLKSAFVHTLNMSLSNYHPQFHPIQLLGRKVLHALQSLRSWKECLERHKPPDSFSQHDTILDDSKSCIDALADRFGISSTESLREGDALESLMRNFHPQTLFRPKIEMEVATLLKQMSKEVTVIMVQVSATLADRAEKQHSHQLRSRQRDNYKRLLESFPVLYEGVTLILCIVCCCLGRINDLAGLDPLQLEKLLRFLKMVLKFSENLRTMTASSRNRWEECCHLCRNLADTMAKVLRKKDMCLFGRHSQDSSGDATTL